MGAVRVSAELRARMWPCGPCRTEKGSPFMCVCRLCVFSLGRLLEKERKQTRQTRDGTRTRSPPARAGFWKDDQGDRWGSPAPDKGHDRLAAGCAVDSHIHWRSHLSLATCLQLVAGSLSYHRHTDTGVAGAKLQKRAFSAYEHKHWILMRAERAGALPGHARSALAGHRTRGAR